MSLVKTIVFCVLFVNELSHVFSLKDAETNKMNDLMKRDNSTLCTNSKCIMKCCPSGTYLSTRFVLRGNEEVQIRKVKCDIFNETKNIPNFDVAMSSVFMNKPNISTFDLKSGVYRANKTFRTRSVDVTDSMFEFNVYLNERAEVLLETPNAYDRWIHVPDDMYCLDLMITYNDSDISIRPGVWTLYLNTPDETNRTNTILMITGMLVSCFFLLVVLIVYGLLKELRNLCGRILMAYVASLFGAFLFLAVMRIQQHESGVCLGLTLLIYFFFMASFCWMSVMSYDIWWTFRGYAKARPIHRRGERFKFLMYCLYAWGLPLAMTAALSVLNSADMRHVPWFITPKIPSSSCFIKEGEKLLYLYMPMLILILCNWLFYLMTAYNVWRLSRGTAVLDSAAAGTAQAHRSNLRRFMVYLKLSVVMGLNWLLEVMSYKYPNSAVWVISDYYNIFIGVSIFLIFVCKRKILRKLVKLCSRFKKTEWHPNQENSSKSATSTCDSNCSSSQDTQTVQTCLNPKGSVYVMNSF